MTGLGSVAQLGYVGLEVEDPEAWVEFGVDVLGLERSGETADGRVCLTNDEHHARFFINQGSRDDLDFIGWEVMDARTLESVAGRLAKAGGGVVEADRALCRSRGVAGMVTFVDPEGNAGEVFYGPVVVDPLAVNPRLRGRFVTGDLGMGHVSLAVTDWERFVEFYEEGLGMRLSGMRLDIPFPGGQTVHVATLRCNARQHSLSLLQIAVPKRVMHIGLEVSDLDDLGRALDRADARALVKIPLGRHAADHMLSFYMAAPGGLEVEYGWGGRLLPEHARVEQYSGGPSIWGHKGLG